jgi:hypothetical protein
MQSKVDVKGAVKVVYDFQREKFKITPDSLLIERIIEKYL